MTVGCPTYGRYHLSLSCGVVWRSGLNVLSQQKLIITITNNKIENRGFSSLWRVSRFSRARPPTTTTKKRASRPSSSQPDADGDGRMRFIVDTSEREHKKINGRHRPPTLLPPAPTRPRLKSSSLLPHPVSVLKNRIHELKCSY